MERSFFGSRPSGAGPKAQKSSDPLGQFLDMIPMCHLICQQVEEKIYGKYIDRFQTIDARLLPLMETEPVWHAVCEPKCSAGTETV